MTLPLTKPLDPSDFAELAEELQVVDRYFTRAAEQHPMRRWEYALAVRAYDAWAGGVTGPVYDVGGSGSPFYRMLDPYQVLVVDPKELHGKDLAAFLREGARLGRAVFCLSVLEHVEDLDRFLYHLSCLVAPGGLLFLTMDYCDNQDPGAPVDRYHFHWMRKRIFSQWSLTALVEYPLLSLGFSILGDRDPVYHGDHVYNYSFASLALVKRA